jgi:hypothetical protein
MTSRPLAAKTSRAVASAGSDNAWVSMPRNRGPSMPVARRCSQMAWLVARTCPSLKLPLNAEPRCPDVPNETRWAGFETSGVRV